MTDARPHDPVFPYSAAFASGAAALVFEIAAARLVAPHLGATPGTATAVLGAFLAALAIGARVSGALADRLVARGASAARVARDFAVGGAVLAAIAPSLAGALFASYATGVLSSWPPSMAGFLIILLLVFLPGLAMGGPTAALVAAWGRERSASLYAVNTAGAVLGAVSASFVLVERVGVAMSCRIAAAALAVAAVLAHAASRAGATDAAAARAREPSLEDRVLVRPALFAFACGFGGLAVEVFGLRALHQVLPGSSPSLAAALSVFLAGNALGAWLGSRFLAAPAAPFVAALLAPFLVVSIVAPVPIADALGAVVVRAAPSQWIVALALLPGSLASGAAFALALRARDADAPGSAFGAITLANTLGALGCAFGIGVVLLPEVGVALGAVIAIAIVALALGPACRGWIGWACSGFALACGASLLVLDLRALPPLSEGDEILTYREGAAANVLVVRAAGDSRPGLILNRTARQGGGSTGERVERRQGVLPALIHPAPLRALVLGVGTGATVEGLLGAGARSVDAVEIVPEVLDELGHFAASQGDLRIHPNVSLLSDDAVAFTARARTKYDLVVGDLYFPWTEGASLLYSAEHFENVRSRLAEGGAFWQWIPLHQVRFEDFGRIAETFRSVFSEVLVFLVDIDAPLPIVALVGSNDPIRVDEARLDAATASRPIAAAVGLHEAEDILDLYLGDRHTLAARFGTKTGQVDPDQRITFDRPRLEFLAARTTEPEFVLALNNWNNVALQLGDTIEPWLDLPAALPPADRDTFLLSLRRRAAATRQYLLGRYWELRARWIFDDVLGDEEREAEQYRKVLLIEPRHAPTARAVDRLLRKRLADRRYQQVVDLGSVALAQNPQDVAAARNVGLALLLLDRPAEASLVLARASGDEDPDSFALTALCVALYLEGKDGEAATVADRALESTGAVNNNLASAVKLAVIGRGEEARAFLARVIDHPQWGVLAKRIVARLDAVSRAAK